MRYSRHGGRAHYLVPSSPRAVYARVQGRRPPPVEGRPPLRRRSGPLVRMCAPGHEALLQPDYLVRHCRETNNFCPAMLAYYMDAPPRIGSSSARTRRCAASCPPRLHLGSSASHATAKPQPAGPRRTHAVDFAAFYRDVNPAAWHTDLPCYPSQLHTYPARDATTATARVTAADLAPILVVASYPICPAAIYISLALPTTPAARRPRRIPHLTPRDAHPLHRAPRRLAASP